MKNIIIIITLVVLMASACDKIEVEPITDQGEIGRYITDSYIGESLLKPLAIGEIGDFTYAGNDTIYNVKINSINSNAALFTERSVEYQYGQFKAFEVTITDNISREITKTTIDTVITDTIIDNYDRYCWFEKLGDNQQKYSGWLARGFRNESNAFNAKTPDIQFRSIADGVIKRTKNAFWTAFCPNLNDNCTISFLHIDMISKINPASPIVVTSTEDTASWNIYITYETDTGYVTSDLKRPSANGSNFLDTINIFNTSSRFGNLLMISYYQQINDSTFNQGYFSIPVEYK